MIKGNTKIRHIFRNGKRISRITRGNDVIFRDNLFNGYDSEWTVNRAVNPQSGLGGTTVGGNTAVFFFRCKANTTYRYTSTTAGDRFSIFALDQSHDRPPVLQLNVAPYSDNIRVILKDAPDPTSIRDYTFTTSSTDRMVYIYCALNTRPTGIYVREI